MNANAGQGIAVGWPAAERPVGQVPTPGRGAAERARVPLDSGVPLASPAPADFLFVVWRRAELRRGQARATHAAVLYQ